MCSPLQCISVSVLLLLFFCVCFLFERFDVSLWPPAYRQDLFDPPPLPEDVKKKEVKKK
jgi:hypothetical protein